MNGTGSPQRTSLHTPGPTIVDVADEPAQLRALVAEAWAHRGTPALREHAERIVDWHYLRPLARGDVEATVAVGRAVLQAELERQRRLPSVDDLVRLCRADSRPEQGITRAA